MQSRPIAVIFVSSFLFAAAATAIFVGVTLLSSGVLLERLAKLNEPGMALFRRLDGWAVVFLFVPATGTACAAVGLLLRRNWAWWFAVTLFAVNACGDMTSFIVTRDAIRSSSGVAISAAFLFVLCHRNVRLFFSKP